jgi:branched-subunit amino acid transport protein
MKPQTYKKISAILSGFLSFVPLAILFVPTLAFSDNQQTY